MKSYVKIGAWFTCLTVTLAGPFAATSQAADLLSAHAIDQLAARRFWQTSVPVPADDRVVRTVLVDDNLYVLTEKNLAFAVHATTGVIRWTARAAEPGQTLRGPSHSAQFVFFTGPASVRALDRATGDVITEPRALRGVIFNISHDIATVSIGRANGIRQNDVLNIYRAEEDVGVPAKVVAQVRVTIVDDRHSKGEIVRSARTIKIEPGMRVAGDVKLPIQSVTLPFAATCPAVADSHNLYIGAANQRFYSLEIVSGLRNWETSVPHNVTAPPLLLGDSLYFASEAGRVTACAIVSTPRSEARQRWEFETEGPVFHGIAIAGEYLYVASNDRQLYALNRQDGRRVWSRHFDNPPEAAPRCAGNRLYHAVKNDGLHAFDAVTGDELWKTSGEAAFLAHFGPDAYLYDSRSAAILRVNSLTGRVKVREDAPLADYAQASTEHQLILLANSGGTILCIRPKSAPPLRPAELAAVLRNDERARELARLTAVERAKAEATATAEEPKRPDLGFLDEDDLLGSRSTAKPAGGRGLVEVETTERDSEKSPRRARPSEEEADAADSEEGEAEEEGAEEPESDEDADGEVEGADEEDAEGEDSEDSEPDEGEEDSDEASEDEESADEEDSSEDEDGDDAEDEEDSEDDDERR
ncbi:MAG TPA: PQQ-binding-like beta-propeller repeat protein [Phycisphaerae bacterium]|nr:PQQ-binding-like beta-propeller repeat protein [Phycisphaerae bacterium]